MNLFLVLLPLCWLLSMAPVYGYPQQQPPDSFGIRRNFFRRRVVVEDDNDDNNKSDDDDYNNDNERQQQRRPSDVLSSQSPTRPSSSSFDDRSADDDFYEETRSQVINDFAKSLQQNRLSKSNSQNLRNFDDNNNNNNNNNNNSDDDDDYENDDDFENGDAYDSINNNKSTNKNDNYEREFQRSSIPPNRKYDAQPPQRANNNKFQSSNEGQQQQQQQQQQRRDTTTQEQRQQITSKGALYDAYNQLHILAQGYAKPFDAPAVVVVGHQSSGKSALIEALMGFQFNQVGGGTKTRRPVALRMQYNPKCHQPRCYLIGDDGVERPMTLSDIQDYIDRENRRLERDPVRSFDSKEIHVRMEYKYCPNMILIDTPGLIAAPRIPSGRGGAGAALAQQRALQASAKEAERLVVEKMRCEDYIILCVEDTSDWKHGHTREIVQKADPDLSRTVIVNTKLDTKIPQFGTPSDVDDFLRAGIMDKLCPHRLGGPFFTSVPSGRVGRRMENMQVDAHMGDYLFETDEEFVHACSDAENADRAVVTQRLKRIGKMTAEFANTGVMGRIGLSRLRSFLEQRVDECYRRNVAKIIPMLQAEYTAAEKRLQACEKELEALSVERLKAGADAFCEEFCVCLRKAMQGSIVAPAAIFGETLAQETSAAGSFHDIQGCPMAVSDRTWDRFVEAEVGNHGHRLYGGSQYHRTLREFNLAGKCLRLPSIAEDEIANAAGIGDTHDGVNFLHAACVIALEKARTTFEPLLGALQVRVTHVLTRLCPVVEYMIREGRERSKIAHGQNVDLFRHDITDAEGIQHAMDISQNPQFRQLIRTIFERFVQRCSDTAVSKCRDDLNSITRFVTWNLDERSGGALRRSLPDHTDLVSVYQVVLQSKNRGAPGGSEGNLNDKKPLSTGALAPAEEALRPISSERNADRDYFNLLQLMEEAAMSRDANRTSLVVGGLVHHIVGQWREQFCRTVTTKFNCYFMLPFVEDFNRFMRRELQRIYEGEENKLTEVFDLTSARRSLQVQREELIGECLANKRLQEKFDSCARMMGKQQQQQQDKEADRAKPSWFSEPGRRFDRNERGDDDDYDEGE